MVEAIFCVFFLVMSRLSSQRFNDCGIPYNCHGPQLIFLLPIPTNHKLLLCLLLLLSDTKEHEESPDPEEEGQGEQDGDVHGGGGQAEPALRLQPRYLRRFIS